jgi:hypothetical protein
MAKLLTAAQISELKRLAATSKPLRSALEIAQSGRPQDLGPAQKKLLQQALNMSPKDFTSAVESRVGLGSKVRSAADLPKAPASTPAPTPAKTPSAASKAGRASKVLEKKAGSALKTAGKAAGKIAAPVAAVGEAVNVANLILNEEARQEAKDYVAGMEDDNVLMRAGKSFISPSDTIFGAGSATIDAVKSLYGGDKARMDLAAMSERLEPKRAAAKAKGDQRESALGDGLNDVQMKELERAAVKSPELLKEYAAIQSPEQAKALYDSAFGDPEPTAEEVVDQGLAAVDEEPSGGFGDILEGVKEGVESGMAAAKAKKPVTRGDLDPDMQDMMGTTGDDPDDYDLAGGAEEPESDYTEQAIGLFKNTHATEFDPKSSMDKGKLEKMKKLLAKQGGLGDMTANQFALQVYRDE